MDGSFFYIKDMKWKKPISIIVEDIYGNEEYRLVCTEYGIAFDHLANTFIYYWRKDNITHDCFCELAALSSINRHYWVKDTKRWYDVSKPKEFLALKNDLEILCTTEEL